MVSTLHPVIVAIVLTFVVAIVIVLAVILVTLVLDLLFLRISCHVILTLYMRLSLSWR